jgi:hypothetical protein
VKSCYCFPFYEERIIINKKFTQNTKILTRNEIVLEILVHSSSGDCIGDPCQHCSRRSQIVCYSVDMDLQYNVAPHNTNYPTFIYYNILQ